MGVLNRFTALAGLGLLLVTCATAGVTVRFAGASPWQVFVVTLIVGLLLALVWWYRLVVPHARALNQLSRGELPDDHPLYQRR